MDRPNAWPRLCLLGHPGRGAAHLLRPEAHDHQEVAVGLQQHGIHLAPAAGANVSWLRMVMVYSNGYLTINYREKISNNNGWLVWLSKDLL